MRVAVLGAGSWGTALAQLAAEAGHAVALWARSPEQARVLFEHRENRRYLPGIFLSPQIAPTADLQTALVDARQILIALPSQSVRQVTGSAAAYIAPGAILVSAAKGLEVATGKTVSDVLGEVLGLSSPVAVLSGPSFARETSQKVPTAVVVAARDEAVGRAVQSALSTQWFRIYTSTDVVGVELGGALKNVIALACGCADGLGFGHNTRAALITRGLVEIGRVAQRCGAHPLTLSGLAGMGDLVLTCTGDLSRNRTVGLELGRGGSLPEILERMGQVAEGVETARSAHALASRLGVAMPICEQVYAILYQGKSPRQAVTDLMARQLKSELG